jgi:two-component system NtrC family sensor kinase
MGFSLGSFVFTLILSQKLRKYCKVNELLKLERLYLGAIVLSIALYTVDAIFKIHTIATWLWHAFSITLLVFSLLQKELRTQRMVLFAFAPLFLIELLIDVTDVLSTTYTEKWESYFDYAEGFGFIWLAVILFTNSRQEKAAEKDRIKRKQEEELNKAIAIRKIELEALVVERTAEITQQKEELEQTLTELQATQKQLIQSEKMASLGELTAGIAHEIQNPLNFVNNFSEVNKELLAEMNDAIAKGDYEEVKALAADISGNQDKINFHGKRADGIVKGMLQHSRSSTGQKEPTDINALADEYLRLSYHGLRAKDKTFNAKFELLPDESIGKINIVPQDIGRVILNLITNAFHAVDEKKKSGIEGYEPVVSVSTKKINDTVEIKVSDNGNGIPHNIIDKIFQPFFTTKPTGKGTGLGLSMSYDIVTKGHAGELTATNNENGGATFIIKLHV